MLNFLKIARGNIFALSKSAGLSEARHSLRVPAQSKLGQPLQKEKLVLVRLQLDS